jgi:threonine dehydrogenase-like Zn-dependent dehydrogenase
MREERLGFCASHLSVETELAGEGLRDRLLDQTGGEMFETVFDATGSPAAMEAGFLNVAHGGTYTLVSIVNAHIGFADPEFHKREMSLLSSRNALPRDFELVATAIRDGKVPTRAMNTHNVAFEDLPREMPNLIHSDSGTIKALVQIG